MSDLLGTNLDGTASVNATFANMREAAIAKATDLASVQAVAPPTPVASPAAPAAPPGTPAVVAPPVNTPPVFGQPAGDPAPIVATPDPALTPAEQQILDLPDTGMFRVVINGQEQVVSGAEAKKRMMLHSDYTRKTQEVAATRKMFGEALGIDPNKIDANTLKQLRGILAEHQQMSQVMSNPDLYTRYGQEVFKANAAPTPQPAAPVYNQPPAIDPNAIVSYGDVRQVVDSTTQAIEAKLAELRQQAEVIPQNVAEQVQKEIQRLEDARESTRMRGQVEATIHSVVQKHPILNAIPNLVDLVKFEAYKMNPQTEKELYHSTQTVLAGILEGFNGAQSAQQKAEAAVRARTLTQGIEPPTGTTPSLQPTKLDPKSKDYWEKLGAVARNYGR